MGSRWLRLALETYPDSFWCNFYRFPSVRLKNVSVEFLPTFPGPGTTGADKVENRLGFAPETYPIIQHTVLIVSNQYGWKMFPSNFDHFSKSVVENRVWRTRFSAWNIPTLLGTNSYRFPSVQKKNVDRILTIFSGPGTTSAAKVENAAQITTFGTRNIHIQFVVQFLSLPISTVEKCLGRILTTFWARAPP